MYAKNVFILKAGDDSQKKIVVNFVHLTSRGFIMKEIRKTIYIGF